jgi:hypothetical protein
MHLHDGEFVCIPPDGVMVNDCVGFGHRPNEVFPRRGQPVNANVSLRTQLVSGFAAGSARKAVTIERAQSFEFH